MFEKVSQLLKCHSNFLGVIYTHISVLPRPFWSNGRYWKLNFFSPHSFIQLDFKSGLCSIPTRSQFFSYHSFSLFPITLFLFSLFCTSFFSPPFLSSSNFFLPFPPAFLPFFYSFPFLFFLFLFPFFFPFLPIFFLSLSSLLFSWFLPPFPLLSLSHCFCFCFFFLALNFFLVSPLYQGGCYEHKC